MQHLGMSEAHLTSATTLSEISEVSFSPSWLVDQGFDHQFWTSGLGSGESWRMDGEKILPDLE
jgi:hypothetical protein